MEGCQWLVVAVVSYCGSSGGRQQLAVVMEAMLLEGYNEVSWQPAPSDLVDRRLGNQHHGDVMHDHRLPFGGAPTSCELPMATPHSQVRHQGASGLLLSGLLVKRAARSSW